MERGVELSADHHQVVNWIRLLGRLLDRSGKPKHVVMVKWEHLGEASVLEVWDSACRLADQDCGSHF